MYEGHKDSSKPWGPLSTKDISSRLPGFLIPYIFVKVSFWGSGLISFFVGGVHWILDVYIYNVYIPGTQITSIFEDQPH